MTRRDLAGLAVVGAVLVSLIGLNACTADDTPPSVDTDIAVSTAPEMVGPHGSTSGVPVGWRHDAEGARAAAVSAVRLTGDLAAAGFITRADMIEVLASERFAPVLVDLSEAQLDSLDTSLATESTTGPMVLREFPLTATVESAGPVTATVRVWAVVVAGVDGGGSPRQLWRTVTVGLVWEADDWKVDSWTVTAGPTPALAVGAPVASLAEMSEVAGWPGVGGE